MYSPPNSTASRRSIATRQRVSRACDRCNHLRVKCDGQRPCEHCLVYGLECKYDRQQKKRGKGSLRNSKGNSSTSTGEPLTPTTTNSPSSSPTTFHLSIPASHLYCVDIPEDKDGYQTDFVSVPSSQQSSQHCTPEPQYSPSFKAEPETSGVNSFPSVYTDERSRGGGGGGVGGGGGGTLMAQQQLRHFFQIPESIMYTSQVWSRPGGGPEAFDGPKCSPSSNEPLTPPEGYQLLPYMPLCASCHCNPSVRLYPGSVLWLPAATSQPHDAPGYGALMCEGGTYCFGDQQKAMVRGP